MSVSGTLILSQFLNRYSRSKGDKEVKRIVLEENIKYPMFGDDYFKRPQYSADLIHQEALKWLDAQTGEQPFCGIFTYTLPHAELAQPHDSIFNDYKKKFLPTKLGVETKVHDITLRITLMHILPA